MQCRECDMDNEVGAESCVRCGKILAVPLERTDEADSGGGLVLSAPFAFSSSDSSGHGHDGLCTLCGQTCATGALVSVRDAVYCPECAPLVRAGSGGPPRAEDRSSREPAGSHPSVGPTGPGAYGGGADQHGGGADQHGRGADPYGGGGDPYARGADPFGGGSDRHGRAADPYGGGSDRHGRGADPFAGGADPFERDFSVGRERADSARDNEFPPASGFGPPGGGVPHGTRSSRRPIHPVKPRRRFPLPAVLLLVVIGAGVFLFWHFVLGRDRIDRLVAEARSEDRSVCLTPRHQRGDSWRYRLDAVVRVDLAATQGGRSQSGKIEFAANTEYYLDVLDVDAAGTSTLQLAVDSLGFDVVASEGDVDDVGDLGQFGPLSELVGGDVENLDHHTVQFRVDRRGRPAGEADGEVGLGAVLVGLLGTISGAIEDRPLAPGDRWTHDLHMGAGAESLAVDLEMVGFARHLGRDCAVMSLDAATARHESLMGNEVGADLEIKGVLFVDAEQGHLVHVAVDLTFEMTMSGSLANMAVDCEMELDLTLQ